MWRSSMCIKRFPLLRLLVSFAAVTTIRAAAAIPPVDEWSISQLDIRKFSYSWTITNFSQCDLETGSFISSPEFSAGGSDKWQLILYPKGHDSGYKNYLSLFLQHLSDDSVKVTFNLALLNSHNQMTHVNSLSTTFARKSRNGYYQFVEARSLQKESIDLLPDDRLTMVVEIFTKHGYVNTTGRCAGKRSRAAADDDYLAKLFDEQLLSDLEMRVGHNRSVFKVHKAVLASASRFFRENLLGNSSSIWELPQSDAQTFREVLRFIYTGKLENFKSLARDLLVAADRFEIAALKSLCEEALCQSLGPENALDIFQLAAAHKAENLKEQASNFIVAHRSEVTATAAFRTMEMSRPDPILTLFRKLVNPARA